MIFISHSNQDSAFVREIRIQLESVGLKTWVDCRELLMGGKLGEKIRQAITDSNCLLVVISPYTVNSDWVFKEVAYALAKQQSVPCFKIIPLLLGGMQPSALHLWFGKDEPLAIKVEENKADLFKVILQILFAFGKLAPENPQEIIALDTQPLEELILILKAPEFTVENDTCKLLTAQATLSYQPADTKGREQVTPPYHFVAPISIIELNDIHWYLEQYKIWPSGEFKKRAQRIAEKLPDWGQALYKAALNHDSALALAKKWRQANGQRRFSVFIDDAILDLTSKEKSKKAANALLALPWELLHDGYGYIAEGKQGGRVRRRLPNYGDFKAYNLELPIKVLLVSPRPLDTDYIDYRITAKPLVQAFHSLGKLVELTILTPPTLQALETQLETQDFHVLHFDGHGVYDQNKGLGALCFEQAATIPDLGKLDLINSDKFAAILRERRIPLVFLEACQSAKIGNIAFSSIAVALLQAGIVSVVAMTHSVLVVSAELFVREFYAKIAKGERIGSAMLAGQRALMNDKARFDDGNGDDFFIEDWFVPVLYQEQQDPPLFCSLLPDDSKNLLELQQRFALGELPQDPLHSFVGRSLSLLTLERLLLHSQYTVITGPGGVGKTTLAVELARWLVQTKRIQKLAFVSLENVYTMGDLFDCIARQLLPEFSGEHLSKTEADALVARFFRDFDTLVILDNCESLLPNKDGHLPINSIDWDEFLRFCSVQQQHGAKFLFTSREALPAPFDEYCPIGALSDHEAINLLKKVLARHSLPLPSDVGVRNKWLNDFVHILNGNARALVLLAPRAAQDGFKASIEELAEIIAEQQRLHPGERELSLFASLELSLRRLSAQHKEWVKALVVFHNGFSLSALTHVLQIEFDATELFAMQLVQVGLVEEKGCYYYAMDSALSEFLAKNVSHKEYDSYQIRWRDAMLAFVNYITHENQTNQSVAIICRFELPNLIALLQFLLDKDNPEQALLTASNVESVFVKLYMPEIIDKIRVFRKSAHNRLTIQNEYRKDEKSEISKIKWCYFKFWRG